MVHDRRIDGETHIFGNAGSLFMNAMTWYDHDTQSIWSQPWGRALGGTYKGVELFLLPSQITTWSSWKKEHPHTLAMTSDVDRVGARQRFDPDFVIGIVLDNTAKAFYYRDVAVKTIVNDFLGEIPVLVWADNNNYHVFVRQVEDQTLSFEFRNGELIDSETGSTWDLSQGLATEGPLTGMSLQSIPSLSSYDWAWSDFYPGSDFYQP
jgi:hypothetical protein